jgi:diguanylate cyclase (GGDEF)-like protein/PAS domain S-box-containing protein
VSKIHRVNPPATPVDEAALRLLADDNPAGMIVHRQHAPLYVNAAWAETHGYSVEEVMTMPTLLDLLAPQERDRMQADVADCLAAGEAPSYRVYQALHRDGSRLWIEALAKPVSWQGEAAVMSTVTHVDVERDPERNTVTERVHRDRQLYMAVLSQVPDRISLIDAEYRYRFANRPNLEFHGLSLAELIGRHVQDVIGPEDFARARPSFDRALRGGAVNYVQDVELRGGDTGRVDVSMRPFRRDGRHIEGVVVTMRDATQLHRAGETLAKSEARLRSVIDHVPALVFLKDRRGRFQEVNPEFLRIYGLERADVLERTVHELFPPQTARGFASHDRQVMENAAASQREITIDGADGAHTYHATKFPVLNETGAVAGVGGIAVDVTEQRLRLDALLDRERQMSELLGNLPGMTYRARVHDGVAHTEFVSDGCLALTGYTPEEACVAEHAFVTAITHPDDRRRTRESITAARVAGRPFQLRYRIVTRSGEVRWVWEQGRATPLPDGAVTNEGFIFDISESQDLSQRLEHQARHDPLTDLLNRRAFEELLDEVVARNRESGREAALLYLDLDRFKVVNDACGHAAGDELLRQLTGRMKTAVRERDVLARLGGDEFALLLEHCPTDHALQVADKLRIAVQEFRFVWHRRTFGVSASIGVVPIAPDSGSAGELLVRAENACHAAKDAGRDRLYVYRSDDPELDRLSAQTRWLGRIEAALNDDALVLLADPVVALSQQDAAPDHYEILTRMHDEEGGLVSPAGFMPIAERHGLAARIDRWVVRRTLERLADSASAKRVSISLSERTIDDAGFPDFVRRELLRTGVDGEQLCFGVTEILATSLLSSGGEFTEALRRQGCQFCLDDFGSGVASFSHLESLPVEYVKLRGALVRELRGDRAARAVVRTISDIGRALGKHIIAAEVHDAATLEQIREAGVDLAQGRAVGAAQALDELH